MSDKTTEMPNHRWKFTARFRVRAFGWRSQPAITRVKEAVAEIKKAARADPALGAEGAVLFIERISPAIEQVDSSSGAMGTAFSNALRDLLPIILQVPATEAARDHWLERLWTAFQEDEMPYIESIADQWSALCVTRERDSHWADMLLPPLKLSWSQPRGQGGYFRGTSASRIGRRPGRQSRAKEACPTVCWAIDDTSFSFSLLPTGVCKTGWRSARREPDNARCPAWRNGMDLG